MTVLGSPIPHPLDTLPWEVPDWAYECLEWVIGAEWPDGDEAALWSLAAAWREGGSSLSSARAESAVAALAVTSSYAGPAASAFAESWHPVDELLGGLSAAFTEIAAAVDACGTEIEAAKLEIWIEVGLLVIELICLGIAVALSAGAATPAAMAAAAATRAAIQRIFGRLVLTVSRDVVKTSTVRLAARRAVAAGTLESAQELTTAGGIQSYQRLVGHRESFDVAAMGMSAVGGLAGGAAGSTVVPDPVAGVVSKTVRSAASEALAETAASLATGAGLPDLGQSARAATSGAVDGTIDLAGSAAARFGGLAASGSTAPVASTDLPRVTEAASTPALSSPPPTPWASFDAEVSSATPTARIDASQAGPTASTGPPSTSKAEPPLDAGRVDLPADSLLPGIGDRQDAVVVPHTDGSVRPAPLSPQPFVAADPPQTDRPSVADAAPRAGLTDAPQQPGTAVVASAVVGAGDAHSSSSRAHAKHRGDRERMLRDPSPEELRAVGVGAVTYSDLGVDPDSLTETERSHLDRILPRTALLPPDQIRFTQRSINPTRSDNLGLDELVARFRATGWQGPPIHGIRWGDGSYACFDNYRLRAAREARLPRVPMVVHVPSERVADWPAAMVERGLRRRTHGPNGPLPVLEVAGRIRDEQGSVATSFGDLAGLLAAGDHSLLPVQLFGTERTPVLLSWSDSEPAIELDSTERHVLERLRTSAETAADRVQRDLTAIAADVSAELGLDEALRLEGLDHRVKSFESLARKYDAEARAANDSVDEFAEDVNDVLRFTIVVPHDDRCRPVVERVLDSLAAAGYSTGPRSLKNFWAVGNRFMGMNLTLRALTGHQFELQLPTADSWRAGKLTHQLYEIVRQDGTPGDTGSSARRIHAFLRTLAVNRSLRLPERMPPRLAEQWPPRNTTFSRWIARRPDVWQEYRAWLDMNGLAFADVVDEFGLDAADFPIDDHLGGGDVQLLRGLRPKG
ncbi:hypothetical protein O7635_03560 [Asanoa sp. WMMD1127]|uniref:WXG100-like domain-containing protein n=1 Tax=Asanoa sp. WMMD1127 TaxID=3016107 RepID=UPI0024160384|nr:hypothetical protein [Asanoa sp. WMMD1127]MDG4820929.1 hypothetical protein [Asanoa sp. WMMD1127]